MSDAEERRFSQSEVDEIVRKRVNEKNAELRELRSALTREQESAQALTARAAEVEGLRAEIAQMRAATEQDAAFRAVGLGLDGLDDARRAEVEKLRQTAILIYGSETAGSDEPPALSSWLAEDARAHPLLRFALPSPESASAESTPGRTAAPATAPGRATRYTPPVTVGAEQPPAPSRRTRGTAASEARAILDQMRAAPPSERAELRKQHAALLTEAATLPAD